MYTFPELLKKIREENNLTQAEFAKALDVSAVLIAMVETGQKEVSKNLVTKLAELMDVHPFSITPFLFITENADNQKFSGIEKSLVQWGEKMQKLLIKNRVKKFKQYAK
ncbi:MAG TPA: helix-turn-helix transcriptional regulator [Waddliaceae bacterium]